MPRRILRLRFAGAFAPSLTFCTLSALGVLCAAPGCSQDHDLLGKDPPVTTTSGTGGAGGEGGAGAGGEGGAAPEEPPGPTKLTVVHGVNDLEAIKICFLAYPGGTGAGVVPWPSGAGLGFARGRVIDPIGSVIPAGSSVQPHVIGGDLGAIAGLDCEEALALAGGGGPVIAAALPVLPASVFDAERSLLIVPMGCVGGPGHTDPAQEAICGPGYTESTPTATLAAAAMSRITTPGKVGFQVLHADAAMPIVDVRITAGTSGAPEAQLAPTLTPGAIGPFPPFRSLGSVDLGVVAAVTLRTYPPGEQTPTSALMLGDALAHSDVQAADIVEGKSFVLVAVGAAPGTASGPFWHAMTYALVKADP